MREDGFTLAEVIMTVCILGILMSLVAPSLAEQRAVYRRQAALNRFAADLSYTRTEAARRGASMVLRLEASSSCPARPRMRASGGWTVGPRDGSAPLRRMSESELGRGLCLYSNGDPAIVVTSRGLLAHFENRTLMVESGTGVDTLTVSVLGRVLRRY